MLNLLFTDLAPVDAVIVSILYDEKWYGNGAPRWIISSEKRWQRPSQTAAQASEQREKTGKLLYRHGSNESQVPHLTRSIENCRPSHRCGSGSCPECTRALQRWFVANVHQTAAHLLKNKKELVLVSLAPDYAATSATSPKPKWEKVIARLRRHMAKVGIQWAIGGSDFSINIDKVNGKVPVLQGQFWLLIEKPKGNWEEQLKALINSSGTIRRPIKKLKYIGTHAQLAYGIKNEFVKRESYLKNTNPIKHRNPHMNTREKKLRGALWLKLMVFLDHIGLEGRVINHNALPLKSQKCRQVSLGRVSTANHRRVDKSVPKSPQKAL